MASVQTKRKRESQDMGAMRPAPHMHQGQHDFQHYDLPTVDDDMDANIDFAAMVNSTGDVADVGAGDVQHDISQLQQQAGDQGNNNANTAAAAMAQYHTMTVPQSTEQTFMTQPTEGGDRQGAPSEQEGGNEQHRTSSFADFEAAAAQGEPNGDKSPGEAMDPNNPNSSKPSVGSDAWHKIRKDNHKEGKKTCHHIPCTLANILHSRTTTARNHQRRHQRARQDRPGLREEQRPDPATRRGLHHPAQGERDPEHREMDPREAAHRAGYSGAEFEL